MLEVDEEQHKAYDPSCDVRRDFDMAASVALGSGHKLLVLRYNPDAFKIAGVTRRTTKKERHAQLIRLLGELLARAGGAVHSPLSLLRCCPAWRSTGPSPCAPSPAARQMRLKYMGSKAWLAPHLDRLLGCHCASLALLRFRKAGELPCRPAPRPRGARRRRLRARRKPAPLLLEAKPGLPALLA